jgi:predicted regulator of Ras-like GTPase activity (Roadblock/LC7/MglB family)
MIPLRIVAPAFLSATKHAKMPRKGVFLDASIPAPFSGGNGKTPAISAPLPAPEFAAPKLAPPPEELALPEPQSISISESEPQGALEPEPQSEASHEPESVAAPVVAEHGKLPETVGEVFGEPHKLDWTPAEIVQNTVRLTGVAGAVVALQEGLQVASSLPDGVKSDVVAAFLPQIFARLNQYAGEMKLGDVDDLLFTTHGAHCQIYRLGYVYFAVLGKPGESLPWHELRLVSEELARQTNK